MISGSSPEYDMIEWDGKRQLYRIDNLSNRYNLKDIEFSLREQGFKEEDDLLGDYFFKLVYEEEGLDDIVVRAYDDRDLLKIDTGVEFSELRRMELHHSIEVGHMPVSNLFGGWSGADSLPELVKAELESGKVIY